MGRLARVLFHRLACGWPSVSDLSLTITTTDRLTSATMTSYENDPFYLRYEDTKKAPRRVQD